ncbi:MAG: CpaF family protein [Alphaproteobacteria bacterium]|nr:CpaF family protein [Alphaproteobacteria bacterium]
MQPTLPSSGLFPRRPASEKPSHKAKEKPKANTVAAARAQIAPLIAAQLDPASFRDKSVEEIADRVNDLVAHALEETGASLTLTEQRALLSTLVDDLAARARQQPDPVRETLSQQIARGPLIDLGVDQETALSGTGDRSRQRIDEARKVVQPLLMEQIDVSRAAQLPQEILVKQIGDLVQEIGAEQRLRLNAEEQRALAAELTDDMIGLGPLEVLLMDDSVTDIMVNGPKQVYVERHGKLERTDVTFRDNAHVMTIATRIVTRIGRRVDESTPMVDARLEDGSRVNVIAPPLAIDGPSISIRKFAKRSITLDMMAQQGNASDALSTVLKIAARSRLNILISGGTGSGKTTLLNAMSRMIDHTERVVTIEDAAELQLQQPHVVRLETRPPNLEGGGEITMRHLVKNALRMRPDRIILGEVRGAEALDMLQAMNTGHDGSMCTLHANTPREALTRLENMVAMSGVTLPPKAVRTQIADAVHLIVQVSRMRDGMRRITRMTEVVGMEGDVVTVQDLFEFKYDGEDASGRLVGRFESSGLRPHFLSRAQYFSLQDTLLEAMGCSPTRSS